MRLTQFSILFLLAASVAFAGTDPPITVTNKTTIDPPTLSSTVTIHTGPSLGGGIPQSGGFSFSNGPGVSYAGVQSQGDSYGQAAAQTHQQVLALQSQVEANKQAALHRPPPVSTIPSVDDMLAQFTSEIMSTMPDKHINPTLVPDPDERTMPYHVRAEGEFGNQIKRIYTDLYKINPYYENQRTAREFGLIAVEEADTSFTAGQLLDAGFYKELAKGFLDIAVGLDPVTGFARSTYELFTGTNLITGTNLSIAERGFAFLGVVTIGGSKSMTQAASGMFKIFDRAGHLLRDRQAVEAGIREGQQLITKAGHLLDHWQKGHRINAISTAEHINQVKFGSWPLTPPFQLGSHVVEFETTKASHWVRVHGDANQASAWVMRKSSIQGLTAAEIQTKYALPSLPQFVSDVRIPEGTKMLRGNIQDHGLGGAGQLQYWIDRTGIDVEVFKTWFKTPRPL